MGNAKLVGAIALSSLLGACGQQLPVDKTCDCGFYTTDGGTKLLHWGDGTEVRFEFAANFPPPLRPAVVNAASTYNTLFEKTRISLAADREGAARYQDSPESVSGDGVNGIYMLSEPWPWAEESPNSDAMTVLKFSENGIIESDIFFRERSFDGSIIQPTSLKQEDQTPFKTLEVRDASLNYQWVYIIGVHELGHAMGRVHSKDQESIMFPTVGLSAIRNPFSDSDRNLMGRVYSLHQTTEAAHALTAVDGLSQDGRTLTIE